MTNFYPQLLYNPILLLFLGLDKIEFLQSHEMKDIYQKAFDIIEKYFGSEEEDARVAPEQGSNQFHFNAEEFAAFQF